MAVVSLTVSLTLNGAISAGLLAGIIDNSPNYSGVILGAVGTISINSALVSPLVGSKDNLHVQWSIQNRSWRKIWVVIQFFLQFAKIFDRNSKF